MSDAAVFLSRDSNQALGLGSYALEFLKGEDLVDASVYDRLKLFHTDSVLCGLSALALQTNAPTLLRAEALEYQDEQGATVLGTNQRVKAEKAVAANSSAVREWDSNGTNFGYRPEEGHTAGEFGHNDFYPVAVAACQEEGFDGKSALRAMLLLDEIRGRLAEVFSLKTYKIDHVVHGGIASAAVYCALRGGTAEQIEHAIGMYVAHFIPWRAIRAGKQLSDSKGASAALAAEAAVVCAKRALKGFIGPKDIFRNPESMFRQFVKTNGDSPFDLKLSRGGSDFAIMGMHFKLGLYEHQSAGALQAVIDLLQKHPELADRSHVKSLVVTAYEPAFGIIGDPAKRDPRTRQSADHSMVYIVGRLLRKAELLGAEGNSDALWKKLMLMPEDYGKEAIFDPATRGWMELMSFEHGGQEYDSRYPEGIPTSLKVEFTNGLKADSGLVMFPSGHARCTTADLAGILKEKFTRMSHLSVEDPALAAALPGRLGEIDEADAAELLSLFDIPLAQKASVD